MYIKRIVDYDEFSDEADVVVTDGKYEIMCYCYTFSSEPKVGQTINELSVLSYDNVMAVKSKKNEIVKTSVGYYTYHLSGKVIRTAPLMVSIGDLILEVGNYIPKDIRPNQYIEFDVSRIDAWS